MPRKDNRDNPLQLRIEARSIPKTVKPATYLRRLLLHIENGAPLPAKWDVRLHWRNPNSYGLTRMWRNDDFESAVSESRSGFVDIAAGMIRSRLVALERRRRG